MFKEDCFHLGVKAFIYNEEGDVLLLQLNPEKFNGKEVWDLPGGRIQKKESLEEALKREIYEETGLQNICHFKPFMMTLSPIRISIQNSDVGLILATYLCQISRDLLIRLSEEHVQFGWFAPSRAAELLSNYPRELMEKLSDLQLII